jgi:hypothetical protein
MHYHIEASISDFGFDNPLDFDHNEFFSRFTERLEKKLAGYDLGGWSIDLLTVKDDGSVYAEFGVQGSPLSLLRWEEDCRFDSTGRKVVSLSHNPFIDGYVAE